MVTLEVIWVHLGQQSYSNNLPGFAQMSLDTDGPSYPLRAN